MNTFAFGRCGFLTAPHSCRGRLNRRSWKQRLPIWSVSLILKSTIVYFLRFTFHASRFRTLFDGDSQLLDLFKFWAIQKETNKRHRKEYQEWGQFTIHEKDR